MIPSEHDGVIVNYVDQSGVHHYGVIVGQSQDGQALYMRSLFEEDAPADYHAAFARSLLELVRLENQV